MLIWSNFSSFWVNSAKYENSEKREKENGSICYIFSNVTVF